ncbi:MAG: serine/threonine protein kinase [Myxococcaceae bacterium]
MAGEPFGKYELVGLLANGGTMEVHLARGTAGGPALVLKRVHPHLSADPGFRAAFLEEVGAAAALEHPNIARVLDFGDCGGRLFMALEAVDGVALPVLLERARALGLFPLPPELAAQLLLPMLAALEHAHGRQRVHRDVAPENLLVSFAGEVKLMDFGLARARLSARPGAVKAKVIYVSPEQARGREVVAASDVFAAGLLLYELCCGRLPVEGAEAEVISRIATGELDHPRTANPALDVELEELLLRALAHEKADRFASAGELAVALSAWMARVPERGSPRLPQLMAHLFAGGPAQEGWTRHPITPARSPAAVPPPPEAEQPRRRQPVWLVGALAIALVIGSIAVTVYSERTRSYRVQVNSEPPGAEVYLDGQPVHGRTPLTVSELSPSTPHTISVVAAGRVPWSQSVDAHTDEVRAVLLVAPSRPRPEQPKAKVSALDPPPPPASAAEVPAPLSFDAEAPPLTVVLRGGGHSFAVQGSNALRLPLDPRRSYTMSARGGLRLEVLDPGAVASTMTKLPKGYSRGMGGDDPRFHPRALQTRRAFYFLEGPSGAPEQPAFGTVGDEPVQVRGATAVHFFVLTDRAHQKNSGELLLRLEDDLGGVKAVAMSARKHSVYVLPENRFLVRRLSPDRSYLLRVADSGEGLPECALAAVFSSGSEKMIFVGSAGLGSQHRLSHGSYILSGASSVWFTLPRWQATERCALTVELTAR